MPAGPYFFDGKVLFTGDGKPAMGTGCCCDDDGGGGGVLVCEHCPNGAPQFMTVEFVQVAPGICTGFTIVMEFFPGNDQNYCLYTFSAGSVNYAMGINTTGLYVVMNNSGACNFRSHFTATFAPTDCREFEGIEATPSTPPGCSGASFCNNLRAYVTSGM